VTALARSHNHMPAPREILSQLDGRDRSDHKFDDIETRST
jgi:hypothetical protein